MESDKVHYEILVKDLGTYYSPTFDNQRDAHLWKQRLDYTSFISVRPTGQNHDDETWIGTRYIMKITRKVNQKK